MAKILTPKILLVEDSALATASFSKVMRDIFPQMGIEKFIFIDKIPKDIQQTTRTDKPFCHIAINTSIGVKLASLIPYDLLVLDTHGTEEEAQGHCMGREVAKAHYLSEHKGKGLVIASSSQPESSAQEFWTPLEGRKKPYDHFFEKGLRPYQGIDKIIKEFLQ